MYSNMVFARIICLVSVFAFFVPDANAQDTVSTGKGSGVLNAPRSLQAVSLNGGSITVDGKLDEAIWKQAPYATGFTQRSPEEGAPATQETQVAFVYDEQALYIGARMYSDNPGQIQAQVSRRDNLGNSERLVVALDTYLDRRTAHSFAVSASGVRADYFQSEDEMNYRSRDYSYDPVWSAKSNIDSLGWTTEIRIPFSQLRFSDREEQVWGLNLNRFLPHKNEDSFWVMIPQDATGWASRFGLLENIHGVVPSSRLEFLPYVAGESQVKGEVDPANPFVNDVNFTGRFGGDIKVGLGPNLTLDGTINPDFGQVEADPAQVNLSAFETFFEEKRPFFTEGQQLFQVLEGGGFRSENYFYSRRIGAAPSLRPSQGDFVDVTSNTSILGASKITGRMSSGLSIGAIAALTAQETAEVYTIQSDAYSDIIVEPLTGYGVMRVQQEFGPYSSTAGAILTGVYRDLSPGTQLANFLNRSALTGGADWNLRFQEGKYQLSGDAGFSYISGEPEAIVNAQRSSARYYQRPDASYVSVDSSRTSLAGYRGRLRISKNSGRHWLWNVSASTKSPGFELNDTGILFNSDDISSNAELIYRENDPGTWYQSYRFSIEGRGGWNYGGIRTDNEIQFGGRIEFINFWSTFFNVEYSPRALDDQLTRGGPLTGSPENWGLRANLNTNRTSNVFAELSFNYRGDEYGGWNYEIGPRLQVRTGGNWEFSIRPRVSHRKEMRQYITTMDGGPSATYGKRYVFSSIDRTTLSTQLRLNYAFTPDLTLEMYAEPFVASGNYYNPGQLPSARSQQLDYYNVVGETANGDFIVDDNGNLFTVPDRDFLVKSFRSNFVLRWQWSPGSTLFLVWQQNRFARNMEDRYVEPGDLVSALGETGDNLFAIKFNYWIPAKL